MLVLPKKYNANFKRRNVVPNGPRVLDRQNKFARAMAAGYLADEVQIMRSVTNNYSAPYNVSANTPVIKAGQPGKYLDFSASTGNATRYDIDSAQLRDLWNGTRPFTLVFHARAESTINNNNAIIALNGADDFIVYISEGINREFRVFWRDVTSATTFFQTGTKYQGLWNVYAYTFDGNDQHNLFINGDLVDNRTDSGSGAGPFSSGPTLAAWSGAAQYYTEDVASIFIFNEDFSGQMRDLSADLYQTLKPATPPVYFLPSGAPPVGVFTPYYYQRMMNQ